MLTSRREATWDRVSLPRRSGACGDFCAGGASEAGFAMGPPPSVIRTLRSTAGRSRTADETGRGAGLETGPMRKRRSRCHNSGLSRRHPRREGQSRPRAVTTGAMKPLLAIGSPENPGPGAGRGWCLGGIRQERLVVAREHQARVVLNGKFDDRTCHTVSQERPLSTGWP